MITNNFEIFNNINPSSFNFNQNRHQNQNSLSSSTSILNFQQQPSNFDFDNNTNNEASNATASTSSTATANYSQKSFHLEPSIEGDRGDKPSDFNNEKENDIDYSLIVSKKLLFLCLFFYLNDMSYLSYLFTGFRNRDTLFTYR